MPALRTRVSNPVDLGVLLRARRKLLGLSQADAAALCNVSPRLLGELEHGRASVGIGLVLRIAATLGVDLFATERGSSG